MPISHGSSINYLEKYANWPILPSNDIKRMLKAFDQTWVGSRYAQKVLTDNGIDNVEFIPAPIKATPVAPHGTIDKSNITKKVH